MNKLTKTDIDNIIDISNKGFLVILNYDDYVDFRSATECADYRNIIWSRILIDKGRVSFAINGIWGEAIPISMIKKYFDMKAFI